MRKWLFLGILLSLASFNYLSPLGAQETAPVAVLPQVVLRWQGWFTIGIFVVIFLGLVTEIRPPDIVMFLGTGVLVIVGVLTPAQFLQGFSNEIIMAIAMLCIIVRATEVNGLLEVVAKRVLSSSKNFALQMVSMCVPVAFASAFLNNTPIVLLMTPIVRKWALKNKLYPSKFLIPLSYAALFGGACTLIGTSTNLVILSLVREAMPEAAFGFFELSYVGIPCAFAGFIFLIFASPYLLPERTDPRSAIAEETREFTVEFIIGQQCPLANKSIKEAGRRYFRGELLIQVERNRFLIDSPSPDLVLFVGDRLVFAGDINQIAELHAIKDLQSVSDPQFKLDVGSSHFAEIVIPTTSLLVGKTLKKINFRNYYGASVLAVYRQGWRVHGDVREIELQAGDTLMLLSGEPWGQTRSYGKDFYYIRHHEKLVVFHPWRALVVVMALLGMVAAVTIGYNIMVCSLAAVFVLFMTRTISFREAQNSIMWNILLLIACSFALGRAMQTTGVAAYFAHIILKVVGSHPYMLIGGILAVTILCTELMTNNAAALILFPIAHTAAKLAGYASAESVTAVGVAVAIGASCAYAMPTGYQTHMIVFGPGGYKFTDFFKSGVCMDVIIWAIATALIPKIWHFY